ncbi:MAG TPA: phage holin family protein [Gemmatimonadaceae bacterium]|nr:phage holin family protein [Gemmatimonadaceae bacterium]
MTVGVRQNGRRSVGALLRDLAEGGVDLVRGEVGLARVETVEALNSIGRGSALVATAAVLALLGVLELIGGLILLAGDQWLPRDLYWLASLIVAVITGAAAIWFARRGMSFLSPSELAPRETVTTIRETREELVSAVRH